MEFIKNNHNRDRTVVHRLNSQSFEYSYQSMGPVCQNLTVSAYPLGIQLSYMSESHSVLVVLNQ